VRFTDTTAKNARTATGGVGYNLNSDVKLGLRDNNFAEDKSLLTRGCLVEEEEEVGG